MRVVRGILAAALAAGITLFGFLISCGVAEGLIDSVRHANGNVSRADVGGKAVLGNRRP